MSGVFIVVLPDKDITEAVKQAGFGCKVIFEKSLFWLGDNIDHAISIRKEDLQHKHSGALPDINEPTIIWFKMLTRPFISNTPKGHFHTKSMLKFRRPLLHNARFGNTVPTDPRINLHGTNITKAVNLNTRTFNSCLWNVATILSTEINF